MSTVEAMHFKFGNLIVLCECHLEHEKNYFQSGYTQGHVIKLKTLVVPSPNVS